MAAFVSACKRSESFDDAIAKHRGTLVDQVNEVGEGVPFFTVKTLNPVWQVGDKTEIVRIPKLSLTDQDGQKRDETLFTGHVSFVGFMFATCHGFCPILVQGMRRLEEDLGELASSARFVALTVNPDEDTPEVLRSYAKRQKLATDKSWTLLTGDKETIYSLARTTFASQVFKRPTAELNFVHSEHLYVIDGEGRLRGILNGTRTDLKRKASDLLEKLVAEQAKARVSLAVPASKGR